MNLSSNRISFKLFKLFLISITLLTGLSACVTAQDEALYTSSLVMAQQGQKEKAYANIKDLCTKFPSDKRFCVEANTIRLEIYNDNMSFVKDRLDKNPPLPKNILQEASERLSKASVYSGGSSEPAMYRAKLAEQEKATEQAIADGRNSGEAFYAQGEYIKAFNSVNAVKNLDPNVLSPLAESYGAKAVEENMAEAEKLISEDNMKEAKELLAELLVIDSSNQKIKEYMEQAEKNDNPDYYMSRGDYFRDSGELQKALEYYKKAAAFPDARQNAQKVIDETRVQIVEVSFLRGVEFASQDLNKQAYTYFMSAFSTMKTLPLELRTMVSIPKDDLELYYDNMYFMAQKTFDQGAIGQSYMYYKLLYDLVPTYHGLLEAKKAVEERVLARALKSIAVIPFKSPVSEPELGLQVTSNIMQILQKKLSDDLKIIERGALEILLREYELAVAGSSVETQAATDSFRIKSADYLLMGEVLDSRTETNTQNSRKKVRVKVSENKIRNIEWEDWARDAEALRKANRPVPPEPPKYIMKPVYDYAEYDVAFHEKVSYLSISYRVVETSQGRVTFSNTVRAQKEARDDATSGIDLGEYKIEMKAANLPTDIEMSNQVRSEAIDKISQQIMDIFKNQDEKYVEEAEKLEASNNLAGAVEMYVNAIVLKIRKDKAIAEIENKAGNYLDVLSAY